MVDRVNKGSSDCAAGSESKDSIQIPVLSLFYPSLGDPFYKSAKMIWDSEKPNKSDNQSTTTSTEEEGEHSNSPPMSSSLRTKRNSKKLNVDGDIGHGRRVVELEPPLKSTGSSSDSDSEGSDAECVSSSINSKSVQASTSQEIACTEIRPRNVRWFYKPSESKSWIPFTGFDSIRIELKYRRLQCKDEESWLEVLQLTDEKELADFNVNEEKAVVLGGLYEVDVNTRSCTSIFWTGDSSAIMRGVWFYDGSFQPIEEPYASEIETEHVNRFKDYQPQVVEGQPGSPRKAIMQAVHHVRFPEFHVEWYTPNQIYLYSEAKSSKLMRSVTERLGFQKSGYKLLRGYKMETTMEDKPIDITHLVFVVHGVGQKSDSRRIIRNCGSLRKCANWLKEKYFAHLNEKKERCEFFPVEWRSSLKLDGDTVDSITLHRVRGLREFLNSNAMDIMYYTSPLYRTELINGLQTELCRLYQLFCQRNPNFEKNNGKVSIVAHSLGCVIAYDLLTGWNPVHFHESQLEDVAVTRLHHQSGISEEKAKLIEQLQAAKREVNNLEKQLQELNLAEFHLGKHTLPFTIENFFCLGSPLAVFLALRGVRPKGTGFIKDIMPPTIAKRFFNVSHPSDPVAYRIEPLVLKHYSTIMPLVIHYYNTSDKTPYEEMKPEPMPLDNQDKRPQSPTGDESDSVNDSPSKSTKGESRWSMVWPTWVRRKEQSVQELKAMKSDEVELDEPGSPPLLEPYLSSDGEDTGSLGRSEVKRSMQNSMARALSPISHVTSSGYTPPNQPEPTSLEYRLDYVLREGNLENSYISAFTSHTSYWTSYDAAYFILSYLHSLDGLQSHNPA